MLRLQRNKVFFKQKNAKQPLRDQSINHVDKQANHQDKNHVGKNTEKGEISKFLSRNQKKCNDIVQPIKKLRIFAKL
ncbi:MAG: hypothetical protein IJG42_05535 [Muribaculaceae bacterium]|jgi:hypothetical protein|nr:hypothetical protein [Muribaculaceae bacterium]